MKKQITINDVKVGDYVSVKNGDVTHFGRVDAVHHQIKNDMPGVDYTTHETGKRWWCYLDQIVEIIKN